ncbi:hypothetical protein [Deinococcus sp.]|uniref:hypothetical protein n=1 Tax=Deinococcus sp. TaxID=47478 RepID=UPI0025C5F5CB|nr:hypothetical protein [Deinococcus sp.]
MAEYLTEREEARERLKNSVDALTQQASLQVNLQKEPLKMLGGASAVGAVLGLVVGRQFKRSKKVYVDADSPIKHQKALIKAQKSQRGGGVGGALVATLGTLAFKTVMDRVVTPRLEQVADTLMEKSGQPAGSAKSAAPARASAQITPARGAPSTLGGAPSSAAVSFTKAPASEGAASAQSVQSYAQQAPAQGSVPPAPGTSAALETPAHPGVKPHPVSHVEAKAVGSPIAPDEMGNPNLR